MAKPPISLTVRASAAALAWVNAFLAAGGDESRATLYQTLCLEFYMFGIQMVGCNGSALFRTWVPTVENEQKADDRSLWPQNDVAPLRTVVIMDHDGFGLGYMKTLMRITKEEGHTLEELSLTTAEGDDEAAPALGDEFKTERIILRACGQRIDLRLFESPFPDWRNLHLGIEWDRRVDGLLLSTHLLGLVSKLKSVDSADMVFHGKQKFIGFEGRGFGGTTAVRGILMPMQRDGADAGK